ncbi:Spo0E family sporulation regulatory protein-aspartic acid phosphatase [Cohnella suwonensis]|uniref:Spo0E family sporulation regulatory protein-aspartic acid phosphatase n=1 Tax=Cohnella suwonensis TaxID=696072 RepID=A0ABW0LX33_9BACL
MSGKSRALRRKIERARSEMMLAFVQNGADLADEEVLRLSQTLDTLLNEYEKCVNAEKGASAVWVRRFPGYPAKEAINLSVCSY